MNIDDNCERIPVIDEHYCPFSPNNARAPCMAPYITTRNNCEKYITELLSTPYLIGENYFISVNLSEFHKVNYRGKTRYFTTLEQIQQYHYLHKLLLKWYVETDIFHVAIIFEQTKAGNIHFHCIVHTTESKHNIRCSLLDLFHITRKDEIQHSIKIDKIDDYQGVYNYIFNKTAHKYENVDWEIFRPLINKMRQEDQDAT